MRLANTPDGSRVMEFEFDSIAVAEELAQAITSACVEARRYQTNEEKRHVI